MPEEVPFDPNRIAAEYLKANQDAMFGVVTDGLKQVGRRLRANFASSYQNYLQRVLERYSVGKSFLYRTEPVPLYDFYVPMGLATEHHELPHATIGQATAMSSHFVISGLGGSGKSLMMRHFLIGCITGKRKTPILVELRDLNTSDESLLRALLRALKLRGLEVDEAYLEIALKAGHFCLLFDGYDELLADRRPRVLREIAEFSSRYPDNWIVVSSRPDSELTVLESFTHFEISPLELVDAVALVQRLPFDEAVIARFVKALKDGVFEQHQSFLSNPLLLSIMMLTYSDSAQIPDKLSLFYNQAYEALFNKHDALKGGYQREHRTSLDIRDFGTVFSAFCLLSYDDREFSFTETAAREYLVKARPLTQLDYDASDFLADAEQAVCLLLVDGLEIAFAHRSFQEYFVARFIASAEPKYKEELIKRYAPHVGSDSVMRLLYEIDHVAVEDHLVLPFIRSVREAVGIDSEPPSDEQYLRYLKRYCCSFEVYGDDSFGIGVENVFDFDQLIFIHSIARAEELIPPGDQERYRQSRKALVEACDGVPQEFSAADLATGDRKFEALKRLEGIMSPARLTAMLQLERLMVDRRQAKRSSLDELLGSK